MATDLDITKWLMNGRVKKTDPILSAPLSKIYTRVLEDTPLVQVHEVLEIEPFVAVIDDENFKGTVCNKITICFVDWVFCYAGCPPTPAKFKVLGIITPKEILNFLNRNPENGTSSVQNGQ